MNKRDHDAEARRRVSLAGFGLTVLMAIISLASKPFEYGSQFDRPIIAVTLLLIAATLLAYFALRSALTLERSGKRLLFTIVCFGISLRAIGLFTTPILEIDYYRYIWDGKVAAAGVSPYSYSPTQILRAHPQGEQPYQQAVELSNRSESNFEILQRIHFEDYRTIYPPVSQFVFASAMKWFPHTASVESHVCAIRAVMVLFDLLTMWLICLILKRQQYHRGWLIAYAWNPLVIKEISNSGHLDAIVGFSIVATAYLLVRWMRLERPRANSALPLAGGIALGLGVGAKIFPVVLFPALLFTIGRVQWSKAMLFAAAFVATSATCLWPMYDATTNRAQAFRTTPTSDAASPSDDVSKEGLSSFLWQWRMNDVIFSGIYLNLKPADTQGHPWYVLTSQKFRARVNDWCESANLGPDNPAFFIARILTLTLFAIFYLWQLKVIYTETNLETGINFSRLTWIAVVFLFLQPTVNPWYWIWIAPLACLSRNAGWLIVAGCLMIYYCRFWFQALEGSFLLAGTSYSGAGLFDHGVAWLEFALIVVALIWSTYAKNQPTNRLPKL
jgi:hypothetical protein